MAQSCYIITVKEIHWLISFCKVLENKKGPPNTEQNVSLTNILFFFLLLHVPWLFWSVSTSSQISPTPDYSTLFFSPLSALTVLHRVDQRV